MEPKRILKSVNVNFISLVSKGANQKTIIYKSENSQTPNIEKKIKIAKTDEDQHLVYGIVYSPNEADSQGDTATAEVIKEMAYNFMKSAKTNNIDNQHTNIAGDGYVAESWILKASDPVFPLEKEGSWAVAIKVEKEETWDAIKKGDITGLSMAGIASVEEIQKSEEKKETIIQKFFKLVGIKKDFNAEYQNQELRNMVYALERTLDSTLWDDKISAEDKKAAILESVSQFIGVANNINVAEIAKAGKVFSSKNLESLKTMQSTINDLVSQMESTDTITKGEDTMSPNEIQEIVKSAVAEAVKPLQEKIDTLEKGEEIEKLNKRLEVVEKAENPSQQQKEVNKSENNNNIFL